MACSEGFVKVGVPLANTSLSSSISERSLTPFVEAMASPMFVLMVSPNGAAAHRVFVMQFDGTDVSIVLRAGYLPAPGR